MDRQEDDQLEIQLQSTVAILQQSQRSQVEIKRLEEMTLEVPFFKEYRKQGKEFIHRRCCALMGYQSFKQGEAVFHIDTQGDKFYIILKGTAGVYIKIDKPTEPQQTQQNQQNDNSENKKGNQSNVNSKSSEKDQVKQNQISRESNQNSEVNQDIKANLLCVKELHDGQSFGELALLQNKKRLASIICHTPCHVATLDKASFHQVLGESEEQKILKEMQFFADLPFFEGWNFNLFKLLYLNSYQKSYSKGQFVFKENQDPTAVYFIKSGEFEVYKKFSYNTLKNKKDKDPQLEKIKDTNANDFPSNSIENKGKNQSIHKQDNKKKSVLEDKKYQQQQSQHLENDNKINSDDQNQQIKLNEERKERRKKKRENGSTDFYGCGIGENGKEVKLCVYLEKELFGEEDIFEGRKRSFGVRCVSMSGELIMIKAKDFTNRILSEYKTKELIKQRYNFKKSMMDSKLSIIAKQLLSFSNYFFKSTESTSTHEISNPLFLNSSKRISKGVGGSDNNNNNKQIDSIPNNNFSQKNIPQISAFEIPSSNSQQQISLTRQKSSTSSQVIPKSTSNLKTIPEIQNILKHDQCEERYSSYRSIKLITSPKLPTQSLLRNISGTSFIDSPSSTFKLPTPLKHEIVRQTSVDYQLASPLLKHSNHNNINNSNNNNNTNNRLCTPIDLNKPINLGMRQSKRILPQIQLTLQEDNNNILTQNNKMQQGYLFDNNLNQPVDNQNYFIQNSEINNKDQQSSSQHQNRNSQIMYSSPRLTSPQGNIFDQSKSLVSSSRDRDSKEKEGTVYQNEMTQSFYRNLRLNYQLKFNNFNVQNLKKHISSSLIDEMPDQFEPIVDSFEQKNNLKVLNKQNGKDSKFKRNHTQVTNDESKSNENNNDTSKMYKLHQQLPQHHNHNHNLHIYETQNIKSRISAFFSRERNQQQQQSTESSVNEKNSSLNQSHSDFMLQNQETIQQENAKIDSVVEITQGKEQSQYSRPNSQTNLRLKSHGREKQFKICSRFNYNEGSSIRIDTPLLETEENVLSSYKNPILMSPTQPLIQLNSNKRLTIDSPATFITSKQSAKKNNSVLDLYQKHYTTKNIDCLSLSSSKNLQRLNNIDSKIDVANQEDRNIIKSTFETTSKTNFDSQQSHSKNNSSAVKHLRISCDLLNKELSQTQSLSPLSFLKGESKNVNIFKTFKSPNQRKVISKFEQSLIFAKSHSQQNS